MKIVRHLLPLLAVAVNHSLAASPASSQAVLHAYAEGFVWSRADDFDRGVHPIAGTRATDFTLGNPNTDAMGAPVWRYESIDPQPRPRLGESRWFQQRGAPMYYMALYNDGAGAWAHGHSGAIDDRLLMIHATSGKGRLPLVRWINPVSRPFQLAIEGELLVQWRGRSKPNGDEEPTLEIDLAIARFDRSANFYHILFKATVDGPFAREATSAAVEIDPVPVEPGDEIVIGVNGDRLCDEKPGVRLSVCDKLQLTLASYALEP